MPKLDADAGIDAHPGKLVRWDVYARPTATWLASGFPRPTHGLQCASTLSIEALPVDRLVPQMPGVSSIFSLGGVGVANFSCRKSARHSVGAPDKLNLDFLGYGQSGHYGIVEELPTILPERHKARCSGLNK
jgi:hypothetical protein